MPDLVVLPAPEVSLELLPPDQIVLQISSPTSLSITVQPPPVLSLTVEQPPVIGLTLVIGQGPAGAAVSTYETISKNLRSADFELVWESGVLMAIEYVDGKRKEFDYAPTGELATITLFNELDVMIGVKSLIYVDGELTNVAYA